MISPNMHKSLEENTNKHCDQQCGENTERNRVTDFAAGEALHNVQEIDTLLTLQTSHLNSFWI